MSTIFYAMNFLLLIALFLTQLVKNNAEIAPEVNQNPTTNISLRYFIEKFNNSNENFEISEPCQSDGLFILEWLENSHRRLKKLKVPNCSIERVLFAKNLTLITEFTKLEEIDFSSNHINSFQIDTLNLVAPNLLKLNLRKNLLKTFSKNLNLSTKPLQRLEHLDLSQNLFTDLSTIKLPSNLRRFNFSHNSIEIIEKKHFLTSPYLSVLDLSLCSIRKIEENSFENLFRLKFLYLNGNRLSSIPAQLFKGLNQLTAIDVSKNVLKTFQSSLLLSDTNKLEDLTLDENPIKFLDRFPSNLINLKSLSVKKLNLIFFDFSFISSLRNLTELNLRENRELRRVIGSLSTDSPNLERIDLSDCSLTQFPSTLFESATKLRLIKLDENPFACDCRLNEWIDRLSSIPNLEIEWSNKSSCQNHSLLIRNEIFNETILKDSNCSLGIYILPGTIEKTKYGSDLIVDCKAFGDPTPTIEWTRVIENKSLGTWSPFDKNDADSASMSDSTDSPNYFVLPGGLLLIKRPTYSEIGPYRCIASNRHGNVSSIILVRLDYSSWFEIKLYSIICGILTAIGFFILNAIYTSIRRLIIWRLSTLEQTSRVRLLLTAMEKYRHRQMENLHDKYTAKMNAIRENYHFQVEQMRKSYFAQSERFRDYRAAQIENLYDHLDSIRDNYTSQTNRVRDYGSRQMERLWESYQRQATRLRSFSLQQRLRLMRQYKIKQRYWNKIFESVNLEMEKIRHGQFRATISPEFIELPDLPAAAVDEVLPGPSKRFLEHSDTIEDFADAVSILMTPNSKNFDDDDDDDDGYSFHSAPGDADLENEIRLQLQSDTKTAFKDPLQSDDEK